VGLLNTCACVVALELGRWAHDQIIQCAWDLGALVGSSLVDMCAKCGNMGGCLEILQQDGISRCCHLEHHDWHMSNGCPDDENASTHHLPPPSPTSERSTNKIMDSLCQENNNVP